MRILSWKNNSVDGLQWNQCAIETLKGFYRTNLLYQKKIQTNWYRTQVLLVFLTSTDPFSKNKFNDSVYIILSLLCFTLTWILRLFETYIYVLVDLNIFFIYCYVLDTIIQPLKVIWKLLTVAKIIFSLNKMVIAKRSALLKKIH